MPEYNKRPRQTPQNDCRREGPGVTSCSLDVRNSVKLSFIFLKITISAPLPFWLIKYNAAVQQRTWELKLTRRCVGIKDGFLSLD